MREKILNELKNKIGEFEYIGDNEKEYYFYFKSLNNFLERDIIYNLIDYIELKYEIEIIKFSLEYKENGSYFLIEKYKDF